MMKPTQAINNTAAFFPNYFRTIGIALGFAAVVIPNFVAFLAAEFAVNYKDFLKILYFDFLIVGVFLIAWSKDKFENEMTMQSRMKALGFTFITSVFYLILRPLLDFIMQDPFSEMSAQELMLFVLLMYIITYRIQKRKLLNQENHKS